MQFSKSLNWWQKLFIIYFAIAIPYSCTSKDSSDDDVVVMQGKTKKEWRNICRRIDDTKKECAVADDVDKCAAIKLGRDYYDLRFGNCLGSVPMFPNNGS